MEVPHVGNSQMVEANCVSNKNFRGAITITSMTRWDCSGVHDGHREYRTIHKLVPTVTMYQSPDKVRSQFEASRRRLLVAWFWYC